VDNLHVADRQAGDDQAHLAARLTSYAWDGDRQLSIYNFVSDATMEANLKNEKLPLISPAASSYPRGSDANL